MFRLSEDFTDHLPCPGPDCCRDARNRTLDEVAAWLEKIFGPPGPLNLVGAAFAAEIRGMKR